MHKNGQILTINSHKYRIKKNLYNPCNCTHCDANRTYDCIPNIRNTTLYCTRTIPMGSILKRIDNVKLK